MRFRSIRLRLMLWYSGVLLSALLVFGLVLWLVVRHNVLSGVDLRLEDAAKGLRTVLHTEVGQADFQEELDEYAQAASGVALLRVRDDSGKELLSDTPLLVMTSRNPTERTAQLGSEVYRVHSERVTVQGHNFDIETGAPLGEARRTLEQFRTLLLVAIPLLVLVSFLGGYWISLRALSPVDELTTAAKRISLENLSERLPVRPTGDELQRLSETWNEMLSRLESAVERVTHFTADASHELRTPLSLILTSGELALRREREAAEYRAALAGIVSEARRMTTLTEDLLALARADANQTISLEPVDLAELAREAVVDMSARADERNVTLSVTADSAAPEVWVSPSAMSRVILILLDNALKHTPEGGTIEVQVTTAPEGAMIAVRDTGEGIAPGDLPHVFERFYRADKARTGHNGVGLGLSIAQAIARQHGSEIRVESVPGRGSRFFFLLSANIQASEIQ